MNDPPHATSKHFDESQKQLKAKRMIRFSPLASIFTGFVLLAMFGLGWFIIYEYRSLQLRAHGKLGSVYINNLLAPVVLSRFNDSESFDHSSLDNFFQELGFTNPHLVLRVWRLDGSLLYSTISNDTVDRHDIKDLNTAREGRFVLNMEESGDHDPNFPLAFPYIEVYAPILDPNTGKMLAIGETYLDATELLRDRSFVERAVWAAVIFVTAGVLAMLALSFRQSAQLKDQLRTEQTITKHNAQLRIEADEARLKAAQANEQVLNLVGAELHDGPIQLIGLMSLMEERHLPDGTTFRGLAEKVMSELRSISAGLILPELEDLTTAQIVELAISRHKALTGDDVIVRMDDLSFALDLPRRICLYRVLQEGLTNAFRHGGDGAHSVIVTFAALTLDVQIQSSKSEQTQPPKTEPIWHLGLHGMRRRLEAFGGSANLHILDDKTVLKITIPT